MALAKTWICYSALNRNCLPLTLISVGFLKDPIVPGWQEPAGSGSHRSVALSETGASTSPSEVTGEQLSTQVFVLTVLLS